ncbi:hypothetical protein EH165_14040 [Nakamurella antarctica]|uniref:Uncharacterized protein n=1 Tax=Nakamurella antarctica TaxID=1902245 RepID=A0A3G8ZP98_9ACTN|nr:hypothetical protein [Nakamurella antarctica]AZI59093.1 hypothetical protein EH165_14040 [Nakamurella antarctica]
MTNPQMPPKGSEQLLSEALRAMAAGGARIGQPASHHVKPAVQKPAGWPWNIATWSLQQLLLLALCIGFALGITTGLTSFYL